MKKLQVLIIIYLFAFTVCAQNDSLINFKLSDSIVLYAKQYIGVKYKYACANPKTGFDCSGFVNYVYKQFNIQVPRTSKDFLHFGQTIPLDSCKPGDVIVFKGTNEKSMQPGHVGIITLNENNELWFIHSSSDKKHSGIKVSNFNAYDNYKKRFIKVVRIPESG